MFQRPSLAALPEPIATDGVPRASGVPARLAARIAPPVSPATIASETQAIHAKRRSVEEK
jgi:hypothetical protein